MRATCHLNFLSFFVLVVLLNGSVGIERAAHEVQIVKASVGMQGSCAFAAFVVRGQSMFRSESDKPKCKLSLSTRCKHSAVNEDVSPFSMGLHRQSSSPDDRATKLPTPRVTLLRIQIMEEVVKRLSDPKIEYHNKRFTILDLKDLLNELKRSNRTGRTIESSTVQPKIRSTQPIRIEQRQTANEVSDRIANTLTRLGESKVVAVLRGGHPDRLYQRGLELAKMKGCGAIEVALDSEGAMEVLAELALVLPPTCIVGAATVMTEAEARRAARLGARFLTSPVNPAGFLGWCTAEDALAIPAGFTPTELHGMLAAGAPAVKLFPACAYSPNGLKQLLSVGPFRRAKVMTSGGITPRDAHAWLQAGATVVGIGTQLVGADTRLDTPPQPLAPPASEEERAWEGAGRSAAAALFAACAGAGPWPEEGATGRAGGEEARGLY